MYPWGMHPRLPRSRCGSCSRRAGRSRLCGYSRGERETTGYEPFVADDVGVRGGWPWSGAAELLVAPGPDLAATECRCHRARRSSRSGCSSSSAIRSSTLPHAVSYQRGTPVFLISEVPLSFL